LILYKYIDENLITVLKELILKVNDPKLFNDPFDSKVGIAPFESEAEKEAFRRSDELKEHYYEKFRNRNIVRDRSEFEELWEERREIFLKTFDNIHKAAVAVWESIPASDYFYVLCLSGEIEKFSNENLMWSHYSNGHRGARLKIDTDHMRTPFYSIKEVQYSDARSTIHISDIILAQEKIQKIMASSIFQKSDSWEYENETRLLFDSKKCRTFGSGESEIRCVDLDPEAIIEVVIGCNADPGFENEIASILRESKIDNAELKKATTDPYRYKLNFVPPS